jgi:hypothetical protein
MAASTAESGDELRSERSFRSRFGALRIGRTMVRGVAMKLGGLVFSLAVISLSACSSAATYAPPSQGAAEDGPGDLPIDEAGLRSRIAELEGKRSEWRGKEVGRTEAVGDKLFWQDDRNLAPVLHRWDDGKREDLTYGFGIGSGDRANYRASDALVVTAAREGDGILYRAYRADARATEVGRMKLPAPGDEQRWWAYAVDGEDVYVVTTNGGARLLRWRPSAGPSNEVVVELAQAGIAVGIFIDFGVGEGRAVLIESGRIWSLDLATKKATWLRNETEAGGTVSWDREGVLFATARGASYVTFATSEKLDVGRAIADTKLEIARGYDTLHRFEGEATLVERAIYYRGAAGVFRFDLRTKAVAPILIDPLPPEGTRRRIMYRYPAVLPNGTVFVTGLTSENGSVGADGPVYRVAP